MAKSKFSKRPHFTPERVLVKWVNLYNEWFKLGTVYESIGSIIPQLIYTRYICSTT